MTTTNDREFQQNEIATSAYEAAGRAFTDSIIRNPDAALALELQRMEIQTPLPPVIDEDSERVAWQLQEQEDFELEQHDSEVAQRLSENDDSSNRQNTGRVDQLSSVLQDMERSSPSSLTSGMDFSRSVRGPSMMSRNPELGYIGGPARNITDFSSDSETEDSRDGTTLTIPWQMQQLAQLQHENHGNRQQPNTEQSQQIDDTVWIPPGQQIFIPNNQQPRHQQLLPVGHIRPPRRALLNPRRQRGPRQIHQSDEIDNSTLEQLGHGRLGGLGGFGMPRQHHRGDLQVDGDINLDDYESLWELQERNGDVCNNGLTPQQIDRIPHHRFKPRRGTTLSEKDCCRICLSEYINGENVKTLPCFHSYHKNCIDKWLKSQAVCPVCRENVKIH